MSTRGHHGLMLADSSGGGGIVSDVKALLHFDGADASTLIVDETALNTWQAYGTAQIDTAESKFGGASLSLPSTGSSVQAPNAAHFSMLGSFTVEAWVRRASATRGAVAWLSDGTATSGWYFVILANGAAQFVIGTGSYLVCLTAEGLVSVGTWCHVAAVKDGLTLRVFIDGVQQATLPVTGTLADAVGVQFTIGREGPNGAANRDFTGHIDEFRYCNVAKYTGNFTPPAAAFSFP